MIIICTRKQVRNVQGIHNQAYSSIWRTSSRRSSSKSSFKCNRQWRIIYLFEMGLMILNVTIFTSLSNYFSRIASRSYSSYSFLPLSRLYSFNCFPSIFSFSLFKNSKVSSTSYWYYLPLLIWMKEWPFKKIMQSIILLLGGW